MGTSILTLGKPIISTRKRAGGRSAQQPPTLRSCAIPMNGLLLGQRQSWTAKSSSSPTYKPLLSDCSATVIILRAEDLPECPALGLSLNVPIWPSRKPWVIRACITPVGSTPLRCMLRPRLLQRRGLALIQSSARCGDRRRCYRAR